MSERPLAVGDLVVYIYSHTGVKIGKEAVVTSVGWLYRDSKTGEMRCDGIETSLSDPGPGGSCAQPEWLKRIPPKSDFEKAEDWFIEDLMRTIKRKEGV
jgi:hypothetical protein